MQFMVQCLLFILILIWIHGKCVNAMHIMCQASINRTNRNPAIVGVDPDDESAMNHGMYFWHASKEGLINKGASIHAGIRNNLVDAHGYEVLLYIQLKEYMVT